LNSLFRRAISVLLFGQVEHLFVPVLAIDAVRASTKPARSNSSINLGVKLGDDPEQTLDRIERRDDLGMALEGRKKALTVLYARDTTEAPS